jgi:hypothetical protein
MDHLRFLPSWRHAASSSWDYSSATRRPPTGRKSWIRAQISAGVHPRTLYFMKLDDKTVPTWGRSWMVRDACSSNRRRSTFFIKIVWGFYGSDLTGFYQSFIKVIKWISGRHNWKSRKCKAYAQLWDANSTALPQSYPASIGSEGAPPHARNVDYLGWQDASLWAGRQIPKCTVQSIPHCYLGTKIEYKKINIFYIDPLPDLRPDWKRLDILLSPTTKFSSTKFRI